MSGQYWSIHEDKPGGFRKNATAGTLQPGSNTYEVNTPYAHLKHRNFRIFLPPGTIRATLSFFAPNTYQVGVISRIGQPPTGAYETLDFMSSLWAGDNGGSIARLRDADYLARNMGGHGSIMSQNWMPPTETGTWLYGMLFEPNGQAVSSVQARITVDSVKFFEWFNSGDTLWDHAGNPKDFTAKPQTPVKSPLPFPGGGGQIPIPEQPTGGAHASTKTDIDYFFEQLRAFEIWRRDLR